MAVIWSTGGQKMTKKTTVLIFCFVSAFVRFPTQLYSHSRRLVSNTRSIQYPREEYSVPTTQCLVNLDEIQGLQTPRCFTVLKTPKYSGLVRWAKRLYTRHSNVHYPRRKTLIIQGARLFWTGRLNENSVHTLTIRGAQFLGTYAERNGPTQDLQVWRSWTGV